MATRAEREQEEAEQERARQQQRGQSGQQDQRNQQGQRNQPDDAVREEQRKQSEAQAKEQKAYLDEMNRKLGDVVETAAKMKDKDPQLLNYTVEALKRASQQLEGATPPNVDTRGQPMNRNL